MNEPLPSPEEIRKIPPEGGAGFNRLIHETSPYLLQHARNPVDWHAWRPEAFEKARKEDKPIFLSVGYSTCHWCHVMERESFEREDVAEILNANFVPIKVDREERPDLDEIYMTATQLFSGRGGWPNSLWLTPDGRPWYAGTYFPPEDRMGIPGFKSLLRQLAELWRTRRADVEKQANEFAEAMRRASAAGAARGDVAAVDLVKAALDDLAGAFDERFGGFGGAPKFPPHTALALIAHECRRSPDARLLRHDDGDARCHGARRDTRSRRRRIPPLLDRRALVPAALREDALRQRAVGPRVRRGFRADRQRRLPRRGDGHVRLGPPRDERSGRRLLLRARRRQRGPGRKVLCLDPRGNHRGAREGRGRRVLPDLRRGGERKFPRRGGRRFDRREHPVFERRRRTPRCGSG